MALLFVVGVMAWAGATLLVHAARHLRARPLRLGRRLARFRPSTVADEAERWLRTQ